MFSCEVNHCTWTTRCLSCILNHYVHHWIDEYRSSLMNSEVSDELRGELDDLDRIGTTLTHNCLFPYQHTAFFHEAFFQLKDSYRDGECLFTVIQPLGYYLAKSYYTLRNVRELLRKCSGHS